MLIIHNFNIQTGDTSFESKNENNDRLYHMTTNLQVIAKLSFPYALESSFYRESLLKIWKRHMKMEGKIRSLMEDADLDD